MRESELWAFHDHAVQYFAFVRNTPTLLPSVLVKVLGACFTPLLAPSVHAFCSRLCSQVLGAFFLEYKDRERKTTYRQHILVQENLFYGHDVMRMCDLKGARRNRGGEDESDTVLDENLFRFNEGYPLLLSEVAKQQLTRALWNDTLFLASINVMDYSLLVGVVQSPAVGPAADAEAGGGGGDRRVVDGTLVVGLIDYCRQFTWKEDVEFRSKRATVMPPKQYKHRFREALNRYFMPSIEKYNGPAEKE